MKKILLFLISSVSFGLTDNTAGLKESHRCANTIELEIVLIKKLSEKKIKGKVLYAYELAGNPLGSPHGILRSARKFDGPGSINHWMQWVESKELDLTTGFKSTVDFWVDCPPEDLKKYGYVRAVILNPMSNFPIVDLVKGSVLFFENQDVA